MNVWSVLYRTHWHDIFVWRRRQPRPEQTPRCRVEPLGIATEPEADYERRPDGGGGCEVAGRSFIFEHTYKVLLFPRRRKLPAGLEFLRFSRIHNLHHNNKLY